MKKQTVQKKPTFKETLHIPSLNPWFIGIYVLGLIGLTICFYYPSLYYSFQFDDLANITKFYNIRHARFVDLAFSGTRWISYWINTVHYTIGKFNPFSYRVGNLINHISTGVVLFFLFLLLLRRAVKHPFFVHHALSISLIATGLFLLHPVQTQTVSYVIQGQLEGMATLCTLGMALCFVLMNKVRTAWCSCLFGTLVYAIGILSCGTKEIAIVAPLLLVVIDWFFFAHASLSSLKKRLWFHGGLFVVVWGFYMYLLKPAFFAKLCGLQLEARNNIGNVLTDDPKAKITPGHFFISQFKVILHYMGMFIWPFNICVEYDWKLVKGIFAPDCMLPFLALMGVWTGLVATLKKYPTFPLGFALIWFFIAIAPRSSIIPSSELLTDYKTYLGSPGIFLLLATALVYGGISLVAWLKTRISMPLVAQQTASFMYITLLLATGWCTYERNKVWRSAQEFWYNVIQNAPQKARAYNNYAVALCEQGRYQDAIAYYQRAIAMDHMYPDPLNNIAVAYAYIGDLDKAIGALRSSITIQPYYPEAYNNLATFLIQKQDFAGAEKLLTHALQLRPHYGKAYFNLGKIAMMQSNPQKACEHFKNACTKADLDNEEGFKAYARACIVAKQWDDALSASKKLLEFDKKNTEYTLFLATAYQGKEQFDTALALFEEALQEKPNDTAILYQLAELYIKKNKPQLALDALEKITVIPPQLAHIPFRKAYCLLQLQRIPEAKQALELATASPHLSADLKTVARNELAKLQTIQKSLSA